MKSLKDSAAWQILKDTASGWDEDNVARLAASLAYYTLLSVAPLIILAVAVAGLAFGEDAAREHIPGELAGVVGAGAATAIQSIAKNAHTPSTGALSIAIGILVLLFGASGVFGELQSALNTVWQVAPKPGRGIWGVIKDRFFSFTLVVGVAFLLLVSLIVSAALKELGITPKELDMAEKLVTGMVDKWRPEKYRDDYRKDLLAMIHSRAVNSVSEEPSKAARAPKPAKVVDLVALLAQSVESGHRVHGHKKASRTTHAKATPKKRSSVRHRVEHAHRKSA